MKPTKQDIAEELQNRVLHNRITTLEELKKECEVNHLDWYEDVLSPLEMNSCDRCDELRESEQLYWELSDWDSDNRALMNGIKKEGKKYITLCDECVKELIRIGLRQ